MEYLTGGSVFVENQRPTVDNLLGFSTGRFVYQEQYLTFLECPNSQANFTCPIGCLLRGETLIFQLVDEALS